ncbi:hypothetical protein [Kaarinaea lacus]
MFSFFQKSPLLDDASIQWMFDCYAWALRHFDAKVFFNETILVVPTNSCFPGEGHSAYDKADLILQQVKRHAGMSNWPVQLVEERDFENTNPQLAFSGTVRGQHALAPQTSEVNARLHASYQAELLRNPQALIANYAQLLGHYLGATTHDMPPGGVENWPHVTELLGVFMGFGLMFANTAYQARVSSCGACQGPIVQRTNYLSQFDITYALAIFTVLKQIPSKEVTKYLKKTLHPFYKKAVKDVMGREEELRRLKEFQT